MKRSWVLLLAASAVLLPARGNAQEDRYALGQRLRDFEAAWDEHADLAARQRALVPLKEATRQFFHGNFAATGRELDAARFALASSKEPEPAQAWAAALTLKTARLVDNTAEDVGFRVEALYAVKGDIPEDARLQLTLKAGADKEARKVAAVPILRLPLAGKITLKDLPEKDFVLAMTILQGERELDRRELLFSVVHGPGERLKKLLEGAADWKDKVDTQRASVRQLLTLLQGLNEGKTLETDYPAARLLSEAEAAMRALEDGKTYFGDRKAGQFWLALAGESGRTPVRLLAPGKAKEGKPLPLVIAVHGMSGSENVFFDAHGRGLIVRLCEERGWLLVAPRCKGLAPPPLDEVIAEVDKLYPVDHQHVFLVGHSLGVLHVVSAVGQAPKDYAAVAALGGGGKVRASDSLKDVPFFVGVGAEDNLMLDAARLLRDNLKKAEVKQVEFVEYADVEHLVVVQAALKDLFAVFDRAAKR